MKKSKLIRLQDVVMGGITVSSLFLLLNVSGVYATGATDEVTVTIPESCSLTSTVTSAHTATVENGVYNDAIGETSINAFCNDSEGFSVYAVGYTNDEYGNNTMKPNTIASSNAIATGLATSGTTSNWAMKLTSASENFTLTNDFGSFHVIPDSYTKVATYPSNTTSVSGVQVKSTYAVYASQTQPADSYTGKVKYTIVHPSNATAPTRSIEDVKYMQDFKTMSSAERNAIIATMQDSTVYTLIDNRDNKTYQIAKLKDGNVWMAEDLDLGRTELTTDLTSANTNLSTTVTASTFNGWKKTTGTGTYNAGEYISVSGTDATSGTSYGTFYNYYATSAGAITGSSNSNNASYDICPAGWRLPTGGSSGEFQDLYAEYNSNALMRASIENSGAAFALAGGFYYGAPASQGSDGRYWSSTGASGTDMYGLTLNMSYVYPANRVNRGLGSAIRCVLNNPKTISDLTYMQDFDNLSANDKTSVLAYMEDSTTYNLIDNRDNKTYAVAKLKDGKIWMAENLDLGRTELTTDLTSANTNLSTTVPASTFNSWKKTTGSKTYDAGEFINVSGTDATSGTAYGTLYNYYAASAGTISGSSNNNHAYYDICPAGWRLPTGGSSGEFQALYTQYNSVALMRASIENSGAAFALAGSFNNAAPADQGSGGFYWSSTRYDDSYMYVLDLGTSYVFPANSSNRRFYGVAIRCVAK